jgi:pilus assembly protein CpaB
MQNRRGIIFLALAVLLGIVAAWAAQRWLERQRPVVTEGVEMTSVVVARVDIPIGTSIQSVELETVSWPAKFRPAGGFSQPSMLQGRVLRRPVAAGEPILEGFLLPEGAGAGLRSVIEENRRAVSVKVDSVIGVAGFVTPGSRVDVMATLRAIHEEKALPYSTLILQDIPVLAIDQRMEEAREGEPQLVSVVTLEVDPEQAEKLIYTSHEGRLQLALRNPSDHAEVEVPIIGVADLLGDGRSQQVAASKSRPGPRRKTRATTDVTVIRGSSVSVKAF